MKNLTKVLLVCVLVYACSCHPHHTRHSIDLSRRDTINDTVSIIRHSIEFVDDPIDVYIPEIKDSALFCEKLRQLVLVPNATRADSNEQWSYVLEFRLTVNDQGEVTAIDSSRYRPNSDYLNTSVSLLTTHAGWIPGYRFKGKQKIKKSVESQVDLDLFIFSSGLVYVNLGSTDGAQRKRYCSKKND